MSENLKLKKYDTPTFFNKDAAVGASLAAIPLVLPIGILGLPIAAATLAVGAVVGGIMGKGRMEQEKEHGKVVSSDPSVVNKEGFMGAMGGMLAGGLGGALLAGVLLATGVIGAPLIGAVVYGSMALGGLGGGLLGGTIGKHGQEAEYRQAKDQHKGHDVMNAVSRALQQEMGGQEFGHATTADHVKRHSEREQSSEHHR